MWYMELINYKFHSMISVGLKLQNHELFDLSDITKAE